MLTYICTTTSSTQVARGLSVPEALRATKFPCSRQYLHSLVTKKSQNDTAPFMSTVITIDEVDDVTDLSSATNTQDSPKPKRKWTSSKEKNSQRIELKVDAAGRKRRRDDALSAGVALLDYTDTINRKIERNRNYIEQEEARNPGFVRPKKVRIILKEVNATLDNGDKPVSKTTLLRYHKIGLDKRRAIGTPPTIPMNLLNCMRLHIKVLQVSKQGQAKGSEIKSKLIAAAKGTEHEDFDGDWVWRRIRELWPDEISPSVVSQQESIRNEWTTYTKVNDWYECNKKTLIESGLAIDTPTLLQDGTKAELTIGETELRRIVNFDETDHPFTTENDGGGSRSVRWGDPTLGKGTERGTRGSRHTTGIYGSSAAGEAMPPVYCFDSSAANIENFQIKSSWVTGLPKV